MSQDSDEIFARELQRQFDEEDRESREKKGKVSTKVVAIGGGAPSTSSQSNRLTTLDDKRPLCKYGAKCYRKNPHHVAEFRHKKESASSSQEASQGTKMEQSDGSSGSNGTRKRSNDVSKDSPENPQKRVKIDKSTDAKPLIGFMSRLDRSNPYRLFVNKCFSVPSTHKDAFGLVLQDLLHPKCGQLIESLQLTFMVDIDFLCEAYKSVGAHNTKLLLLYGIKEGDMNMPNGVAKKVAVPIQYGTHHTKMMVLKYGDGVRIVIHTANLTEDDWYEKTQGYWVSPMFPLEGNSSTNPPDSQTGFRKDIIQYLEAYKLSELKPWIETLKRHDFSECNAFFLASVPGYHQADAMYHYGHMKLRHTIRQNTPASSNWKNANDSGPVIIQCSSIGSLGKDHNSWLGTELAKSLSGGCTISSSKVKVIYPSEEDVRTSSQGWLGGSCLPYNSNTHDKQTWLRQHLHCWRSGKRHRTESMPHIKTYTRLNGKADAAQYFLLTSANLSKAAWGALQKNNSQLFIRSYEAGVLLMPKILTNSASLSVCGERSLPLPYDLPLTPYSNGAKPWFMNTNKTKKDVNGLSYP